ncbi:MAG: response regulator [Acidobacteria bacterium]|nr:response regulator [Acidobacteriota bacterium]
MSLPLRLLVVEDRAEDALLLLRQLERGGYAVTHRRVETAGELQAALGAEEWQLVVSDYSLPSMTALDTLRIIKASGLDLPCIVVSGTIEEEAAVDVLRAGARDFIVKARMARLLPAVARELRDAAERREAEEALRRTEAQFRQAQKMELIGSLAGGIAHDFNNLLAVVSGYCDMLAERVVDDPIASEQLEEINRAAASAIALTRQLLAFSRRQILEARLVSLNDIVTGFQKILGRIVEESVSIEFRLASDLAPVRVDPGQIEQVLLNLVVNARDAMPRGGTLTITTRGASLAGPDARGRPGLKPGDYVVLSVSDTGVGMSPEVKARLFEPFFTTKEPGRGTGLGLATVYGIVKQSDGYVYADSEPGAGTTFTIYFPVASHTGAVEGADRRPEAPGALTGTETVLVVEDNGPLRSLEERILRRYGYSVLAAANGAEAQRICTSYDGAIHLVLMDIVMPGADGRLIGEWIRQHRPDAKVVYMSGYMSQAATEGGIDWPGVAFLRKPFTTTGLLRKVREALGDRTGAAGRTSS